MTFSKSLFTVLFIFLLFSCGSNNDDVDPIEEMEIETEEIDEDNNSNPGLIRSIDDGFEVFYEYDGDRLISASGNDSHRDLTVNHIYNDDGTVRYITIFDVIQQGTLDVQFTYEYDADGRLIEFGNNQGDMSQVSYENNQAIITAGPYFQYVLELDQTGRIVRSDSVTSYKIFTYDSQGKVILAEEYDQETNELINTYEYTYDTNDNPSFGQLQSLYIPHFISVFVRDAQPFVDYATNPLSILANNLISVRVNDEQLITITHTYNSDNQFIETEVNNLFIGSTKNYTFTYYE